jgi:FXSXX-COOH protein
MSDGPVGVETKLVDVTGLPLCDLFESEGRALVLAVRHVRSEACRTEDVTAGFGSSLPVNDDETRV